VLRVGAIVPSVPVCKWLEFGPEIGSEIGVAFRVLSMSIAAL
jgi:hypothetical protein